VLHAFRDAGYEPNVSFESDDYQALQGMAASGIGVALIPTIALMSSRPDVVVVPLRGRAPARQIVAAVRAGEADPLVEHLIEALRNTAHRLAHGPVAAVA
jgi:DNA-binding transcriptional LysR family regulator